MAHTWEKPLVRGFPIYKCSNLTAGIGNLFDNNLILKWHLCRISMIIAYVAVGLVVLALAVYLIYTIVGAEKF